MAIMQSCCCWRSVRRGSFACAVYTVFYYSVITVTIAIVLQEESEYARGNHSHPKFNSVLEPEVSPMSWNFIYALLICSSCGVICCLLLLYGLFKDEKAYLVPWIITVIAGSLIDIFHLIYLFIFVSMVFNPITAMLLTLDFFLLCLNTYSVLCVVSQYQEYAAGRGTASDDCRHRVPQVRYNAQPTPTATSCLSSRRAGVNNDTRPTTATSTTPTQSPTASLMPSQLASERLAASRKHVQFPDTNNTNNVAAATLLLADATADEAFDSQLKQQQQRNATETNSLLVPTNHRYRSGSNSSASTNLLSYEGSEV